MEKGRLSREVEAEIKEVLDEMFDGEKTLSIEEALKRAYAIEARENEKRKSSMN